MNLRKSVLILSAMSSGNLPPSLNPEAEWCKQNIRATPQCWNCKRTRYGQWGSPVARGSSQDVCDICSPCASKGQFQQDSRLRYVAVAVFADDSKDDFDRECQTQG